MYDEAKRAMNYNESIGNTKLLAYTSLLSEQVKAGKISRKEGKALFELKMTEVISQVTQANREVLDRYHRSKASGRSLTCITTTSPNVSFASCN